MQTRFVVFGEIVECANLFFSAEERGAEIENLNLTGRVLTSEYSAVEAKVFRAPGLPRASHWSSA